MKVLIVDDEPLIRRSLERVFAKADHEVETCEDGQQAIEAWAKFAPDIVVLDVLMPFKSGPEVIDTVKPDQKTGIILISAYTGEYNPESAKKLGADQFIAKPFDDISHILEQAEKLFAEKCQ